MNMILLLRIACLAFGSSICFAGRTALLVLRMKVAGSGKHFSCNAFLVAARPFVPSCHSAASSPRCFQHVRSPIWKDRICRQRSEPCRGFCSPTFFQLRAKNRLRSDKYCPTATLPALETNGECYVSAKDGDLSESVPHVNVSVAEDDCTESDDSYSFRVNQLEENMRIDQVLSKRLSAQSRTYFQALIEEGYVRVNDRVLTTKARRVVAGDDVSVQFTVQTRFLPLAPENIPLDILYEDEHLVVVNKAAGMVTHPAPGNWTGTLLNALAYKYSNILELEGPRPGIVHRLDKGTSGVIVAARTLEAHRVVTKLFADRQVDKTYIAISVGNPAGHGCLMKLLDFPLGRSRVDRQKMTVMAEEAGGRAARSVVEVLGSDERRLLHALRIKLETGRTHQIRVHLKHARAPVLGDDLYGLADINRRFRTSAMRPMLHAHRIRFTNPLTGAEVDVSAPLPDDMRSLLHANIYPNLLHLHPEL